MFQTMEILNNICEVYVVIHLAFCSLLSHQIKSVHKFSLLVLPYGQIMMRRRKMRICSRDSSFKPASNFLKSTLVSHSPLMQTSAIDFFFTLVHALNLGEMALPTLRSTSPGDLSFSECSQISAKSSLLLASFCLFWGSKFSYCLNLLSTVFVFYFSFLLFLSNVLGDNGSIILWYLQIYFKTRNIDPKTEICILKASSVIVLKIVSNFLMFFQLRGRV